MVSYKKAKDVLSDSESSFTIRSGYLRHYFAYWEMKISAAYSVILRLLCGVLLCQIVTNMLMVWRVLAM